VLQSNNNVLSFCLNLGKDRSGHHSPGGRSFHSQGQAGKKLSSSIVAILDVDGKNVMKSKSPRQ